MIAEQIQYLASASDPIPRPGKWYISSKFIQALEKEVRGERGCSPLRKRQPRPSRCLREIKGAVGAELQGLDCILGMTRFYGGRAYQYEQLLCLIYTGQKEEVYFPGRAMEGIHVPAVSVVGLTQRGIICAGYSDGLQPSRTASWGLKNHPSDPEQVRKLMDGRCAWTLIDRDTDAYRALPSMVMSLVEAVNQSKL